MAALTDEALPAGPLLSRRHFVVGGTFVVASAVGFARQPVAERPLISPARFNGWVPTNFGGWALVGSSGVVLPPPDTLSGRLYDDLVTRVYRGPGADVMMLLAYNNRQDGVLQVHRPEICYPVGGFTLTQTKRLAVGALGRQVPANVFTATSPDRIEQVIYFTRLGNSYPRTWAEQRLAVVKQNLAGQIPDGVLMRVSLLSADESAAIATLQAFIRAFVAACAPPLQKLLVL